MKVKAAAGALGAPGWGDERCCEPSLCAVTPPQLRAQVAAGGSDSALSPFGEGEGGACVCVRALPAAPPLRKSRRAGSPVARGVWGLCGARGGRVNSLEGNELRGQVGVSKMR